MSPSRFPVGLILTLLLAAPALAIQQHSAQAQWTRQDAAALLERATQGPLPEEIERAFADGRAATVERLLTPGPGSAFPPALARPDLRGGLIPPDALAERLDRRREGFVELCSDHVAPLADFGNEWAQRLYAGEDPLRDRMLVFWQGHFTSSFRDVGDAWKMIAQTQFLRAHAFDRFGVLLRGIARDSAMLQYLNNNKNVKEHPNENWARELLELFSLGDGNYTERDIKECARAFTGWRDRERRFEPDRVEHDYGQKTILGVSGELDGDQVIEIVLEQPACARWLARKLLVHFEGVEPDTARLEASAQALRDSGYDLRSFLHGLLGDPAFPRAELRGHRVLSPLEYFLALSRRSGAQAEGLLLFAASDLAGQRPFFPPSVKGWEGGMGWITTGSLLARSNGCAMLLGLLDARALVSGEDDADAMTRALLEPESNQARTGGLPMLEYARACGWTPHTALAKRLGTLGEKGREEDAARRLAALLRPTEQDASDLAALADELRALRERGLDEEQVWSRAAHFLLSLPQANLD
ncbi:MAG: DUF1800 domain-containing protein [Planctomycetes bacterium]|nr:DUF1800 domain-containing protein [Planctomycetota bacterium]